MKNLSIVSRLVCLSMFLIAILVGSNLYLNRALSRAGAAITVESEIVDVRTKVIAASQAFGDLKYRLTDLTATQLERTKVDAAAARELLDTRLELLVREKAEEVKAIRLDIDSVVQQSMDAADAYTDSQRILGNTLIADARLGILEVDAKFAQLLIELESSIRKQSKSALSEASRVEIYSFWFTTVAALLGLLFTALLVRSIREPLRQLAFSMSDIAGGNLTTHIPEAGQDEIGSISGNLALFRDSTLEHNKLQLERENADITQLREAEATMRSARDLAEQATSAKSKFLATMSHEIRTPMNGIIGMSNLMLTTDMSKEQEDFTKTIVDSAESLLTVINDVLDFSKIEAGKFDLDPQVTDVRECIEGALDLVTASVDKKNLKLAYMLDGNTPGGVIVDAGRLRQILLNLLNNAIKFTDAGEIVLRVAVAAPSEVSSLLSADASHAETLSALHFSVSDTGIGIPEDKMEFLFDSFSQVDTSTTRFYGGTGLGLAISKNLVGMMGGRIWVNSIIGEGSTFHFTVFLPQTSIDRGVALCEMNQELSGGKQDEKLAEKAPLTILLVDDNRTNRKLATLVLKRLGYEIAIAVNGEDAVAKQHTGQYEVILMDIEMPVMDGVDATRAIRAVEDPNGTVAYIIATTANAMQGDRERYLDAGMDGYISKPMRINELVNALEAAYTVLHP